MPSVRRNRWEGGAVTVRLAGGGLVAVLPGVREPGGGGGRGVKDRGGAG